MTSEECPVPLGGISSAVPGHREEYGSAQADDIIEEVGPGDDASIGSDLSTLVVPFPELAPVVFFCLKQTTCPRSWCIRMVSSPYPFHRRWKCCSFFFFFHSLVKRRKWSEVINHAAVTKAWRNSTAAVEP
uniref:Uncharacterized protein n=1 Tax=Hippocampus comes TaxID=109280 RepID=A0A3Q3DT42_HIPCM